MYLRAPPGSVLVKVTSTGNRTVEPETGLNFGMATTGHGNVEVLVVTSVLVVEVDVVGPVVEVVLVTETHSSRKISAQFKRAPPVGQTECGTMLVPCMW